VLKPFPLLFREHCVSLTAHCFGNNFCGAHQLLCCAQLALGLSRSGFWWTLPCLQLDAPKIAEKTFEDKLWIKCKAQDEAERVIADSQHELIAQECLVSYHFCNNCFTQFVCWSSITTISSYICPEW
jgi:hypothetical protein